MAKDDQPANEGNKGNAGERKKLNPQRRERKDPEERKPKEEKAIITASRWETKYQYYEINKGQTKGPFDKHIEITEARLGDKVKVKLFISNPEQMPASLDIYITDDKGEDIPNVKSITLKVLKGKKDTFSYSDEFTITKELVGKKLGIRFLLKIDDLYVKRPFDGTYLTILDGIRIYPLRYGIHCKKEDECKSSNNTYKIIPDHVGKETVLDYPKITECKYYPMPLRTGWLYVYSDIAKKIYEFKYDEESATFTEIKETTDTTKSFNSSVKTGRGCLIVSEADKEIDFFYSEVRLTQDVIGILKEKKGDLMHNHDDSERKISKNKIVVYHQEGICASEKSPVYKIGHAALYIMDENKDWFFIVDDSVGVAKQLQWYLQDKHFEHEVFVRSLRIGVNFSVIKNKLEQNKDKIIIPDSAIYGKGNDDIEEHYAAIHNLGAMIYQRLYITSKDAQKIKDTNKRDYYIKDLKNARDVTNKEFLKQILGVDTRRKLRQQIDQYRKNLRDYLDNDTSFKKYCDFFEKLESDSNKEKNKLFLEVKNLVIDFCTTLSVLPHTKDEYIDEATDQYKEYIENKPDPGPYKDECQSYIEKILKGENPLGKVLHKQVDIEALASDMPGTASFDWNPVYDFAISVWGAFRGELFEPINNLFEKSFRPNIFKVYKEEWTKATNNRIPKPPPGVDIHAYYRQTVVKEIQNVISKNAKERISNSNSNSKIRANLTRLFKSDAYFAVMAIFYMKNALELKPEDKIGILQWGIKVTALVDTIVLSPKLPEAVETTKLTGWQKIKANKFNVLGRFMFAATLIDCYDYGYNKVYKCWSENDIDAAAWYLAAGSISILGGITVSACVEAGWLGGPKGAAIGLLLGILASIANYIAESCRDTLTEKFIKKTIFYNKNKYKTAFDKINLNKIDNKRNPIPYTNELAQSFVTDNDNNDKLGNYKFKLEEYVLCHLSMISIDIEAEYNLYSPLNRSAYTESITFTYKIKSLYKNDSLNNFTVRHFNGIGTPLPFSDKEYSLHLYEPKQNEPEQTSLYSYEPKQTSLDSYELKKKPFDGNVVDFNGNVEYEWKIEKTTQAYEYYQTLEYWKKQQQNLHLSESDKKFDYMNSHQTGPIYTCIRFTDKGGKTIPANKDGKKRWLIFRHDFSSDKESSGDQYSYYKLFKGRLNKIKIASSFEEFDED